MLLAACLAVLGFGGPPADSIVPANWLVIAPVDRGGRRPLRPDAVFARHLLRRDAPPPKAGETLRGETDEERGWKERAAEADGRVGGEIGYAYAAVESEAERVWMAKLSGAGRLFVNGTGFVGDAYGYGFGGVPIALRKGRNDLYVTGVRGSFRLELSPPEKDVFLAGWDATFPDAVAGTKGSMREGAVLVVNASTEAQRFALSSGDGRATFGGTVAVELPALSLEKVPVPCFLHEDPAGAGGKLSFPVHVVREGIVQPTHARSFELAVRPAGAARRVTFRSRDDDSLQECALLPATGARAEQRGVVLSLHGASVECWSQINAYSPKPDFTIVAPTNRRPYGFDWQDWGRTNAYESLLAVLGEIPRALYLTGHSMGGHGTWHLAANDPDRFAAIAPSAGWVGFDSYGGRPDGALKQLWHAADGASDTLASLSNLAQLPVFVLHGTADDNVPLSEAETMEKALAAAGKPPRVHHQEGAGHWWDGESAPGADCVDWPGIFELFRESTPRAVGAEFEFTTVDPSLDAAHGWVSVLQLLRYGERASVRGELRAEDKALVLATRNVRYLRLRPPPAAGKSLVVDGQPIEDFAGGLDLLREEGRWRRLPADPDAAPFEDESALEALHVSPEAGWKSKSPDRSGPFKRAFTRGFVLVYGTQGSSEERRELFERARSDAQAWWYRGNGRARLLSDYEYLAQGSRSAAGIQGNVILYGNADTNLAWKERLGARSPIQVRRGALAVGSKEWKGDDLCALFVFPPTLDAPGMPELFGLVGDTGPAGTRLGYTTAAFVSGVGYPDYTVFDASVLARGDGGVLAAGWFDATWQLDGHGYLRPEAAAPPK